MIKTAHWCCYWLTSLGFHRFHAFHHLCITTSFFFLGALLAIIVRIKTRSYHSNHDFILQFWANWSTEDDIGIWWDCTSDFLCCFLDFWHWHIIATSHWEEYATGTVNLHFDQRWFNSLLSCQFCTVFTRSATDTHQSWTRVLHNCLHICEV